MIKIALCDDNPNVIQQYADLITGLAKKHNIEIQLSYFNSGESLLFHYTDIQEKIDIIYLDIIMNKMDGIETAKKLQNLNCNSQIIFLTNCDDFVYEAFDVNAAQYLVKENTNIDKFEKVFLKATKVAAKKEEEFFTFEFDGSTNIIPLNEISYFDIWKRIVTVHYGDNQTAKFYARMDQIESKLADKDFARVHRSYLVHLPHITMFHNQNLQLKTGESIPVGVTYVQSFKKYFSNYISRFHILNFKNSNVKEENA